MKIYHTRDPLIQKADNLVNAMDAMDKWLIEIEGQSFDYYTGIGHRKTIKGQSVPVTPKEDDILQSLIIDVDASDELFADWCLNCGYSTDSRQALNIYLECQENAKKLRKTGIDIESERERLKDY